MNSPAGRTQSPPARTRRPWRVRRPRRRRVRNQCRAACGSYGRRPQRSARAATVHEGATKVDFPLFQREFSRSRGRTARRRTRFVTASDAPGADSAARGVRRPGHLRVRNRGCAHAPTSLPFASMSRAHARTNAEHTISLRLSIAREQPAYLLPHSPRSGVCHPSGALLAPEGVEEEAEELAIFPIHAAHDGWARRQAQRAPRGGRTTPTRCSKR